MAYINNDPAKGANISIANLEKAAMPMIIEITTTSGKKESFKFPVEIWEYDNQYVLKQRLHKQFKVSQLIRIKFILI